MQEFTDHSSYTITMDVYTHVDMSSTRAAAEALGTLEHRRIADKIVAKGVGAAPG